MMSESDGHNAIWQADSTHPDLAEKLRQNLREVFDPELGLNIIQLGLIRDVAIQADEAQMTMILTTPFCPYGPALIDMVRKKAEFALEKPTKIEMGMEMWDFSMMEEGSAPDWGLY
jgi:metal-sulfur cluster biosynthetic enzyme